ncbi:MAG: ATP-binding cassette domain-containing protein, partial [Myxococcota bacterium]|nr:ATP-binding cassette domain-containing protein [Myxococcota bacterium]
VCALILRRTMIEFINIWKSFGDKCVLAGVNLCVKSGEVFFIVGSSGAGKSVLVKHLVGLLRPDEGQIRLDGRDITALSEAEFFEVRKRCAMVFQNATLFDSMSLVDNVALPIRKHFRVSTSEARRRATSKLELVGMAALAERFPAEFGDGMRKKVAIARALTLNPEYVIFDEPTTGVDPISARMVDRVIADLSRHSGVTAIVISHDLRSIFSIADRIALLYQGRFLLDGSRQVFRDSQDPIVRQFMDGCADGPMEL